VARILIRRVALSIPMLLGMSVIVFAIIRPAPSSA
jgi:ABC-type dipeptide/oligopeptide/nickel transport system permease component